MKQKELGMRLSVNGGRFGEELGACVAKSIRSVGMGDIDKDGVPDMYDCQPLNPDEDGFWGDVGRAAKERVANEIEDIRERSVKRVSGVDAIEKRKTLRRIKEEEEFAEATKQARERGKQKAQARYGVTPTVQREKPRLEYREGALEMVTDRTPQRASSLKSSGIFSAPPKRTTIKKKKKSTKMKYPSAVF